MGANDPHPLPPWPAVSLTEAHARLTAPGQTFEMEEIETNGQRVRAWKNGPKTLVDLWTAADAFGDSTFLVHDSERVTYDAFRRATFAFAAALMARGVRRGDRVAIAMRNQPEWIVAFYGTVLAGAVATPLNAWWSGDELTFALRQSGACVAIFDAPRFSRVEALRPTCPELRLVIVSGLDRAVPDTCSLEDFIGPVSMWADLPVAGSPPVAVGPDDNATIFYTSGTSGVPKGAVANHRAATTPIFASLLSKARSYVRRGEAPPATQDQRRSLLAIPLFHVTGCLVWLNVAVATGGLLVIIRKWDPEIAMQLIERERIESVGGVPTIAWQLLEHPSRERYDLSSIDSIAYGGAPAAPELVRRLLDVFPKAYAGTGWGMTETCATFTHHQGEDYQNRPDSCGPATPVGDMKIVDAQGHHLPAGAVGELLVRGPHVVQAYWRNPEATASTFEDGWLRTGDLAKLDDEGFCTIVDRAKDVIIRGGENIYSVEVEDVLYRHPAIMDAALVPIPHKTLGEEAAAIVTLKSGAQANAEELKDFVGAHLAAFKVPAIVITRREPLPRNANGKIRKTDLKTELAEFLKDRVA